MDKYEYLTGENLEYKPGVVKKVRFEYSSLDEALSSKTKSKTDKRTKIVDTDKQDENLIYNSQHSFVKFKNISDFKKMSFDSMHKKLHKFKNVSLQTKSNEDLKAKVLDNVEDLFNEFYYIYKERYEEEKDTLNKKEAEKRDYTKLRLADDYLYKSEKEDKQTDKNPDKKEPPIKPTKSDVQEFDKLINKEETGINRELF